MNLESIKAHFKKHRRTYAACGVTAVVVGGVAYVIHLKRVDVATKIAIDAMAKANTVTIGAPVAASAISSVSAGRDAILTTVINHLERQGHPGNLVRHIESGAIFASQNQAANAFGIDPSNLSKHLLGKIPHVGGETFEVLGLFPC